MYRCQLRAGARALHETKSWTRGHRAHIIALIDVDCTAHGRVHGQQFHKAAAGITCENDGIVQRDLACACAIWKSVEKQISTGPPFSPACPLHAMFRHRFGVPSFRATMSQVRGPRGELQYTCCWRTPLAFWGGRMALLLQNCNRKLLTIDSV